MKEFLGHMKETDTEVPYRHGPYFYYTRSVKGKPYKIHCRSKEVGGAEQVRRRLGKDWWWGVVNLVFVRAGYVSSFFLLGDMIMRKSNLPYILKRSACVVVRGYF